ncbi:MAG: OmpA family protein, partial [Gemmatimonadetes bacterium]|nr:OmpA family protein [Gemmatimonadota bacterium]
YDDECPNSAEDFDGFMDDDGCPDLDNDGDGIVDELDSCPDEAEDFDGIDDSDGCPELDDRDGDGLMDADDQCPDEPEDFDGFEDGDGCPDEDNDQDGILDAQDRCMNNAETYNGYMDDDGCPDIAPRENLNGVHFEFNSAKLKLGSQQILDELVRALKANPDVNVQIEGHTDDVGSASYNKDLSGKRAKAVVDYLISKGINGSRLSPQGYGEERPIASNKTPEGRLENRRVEVIRMN